MHRKQDSYLIPADTELEKTLRSLRKTKRAENATMTEERHDQTTEQIPCLMHGIDPKTHMDIVSHALNDTPKGIIDASCCGAFKCKSAEEARDLIEDLEKCNMKAPFGFSRGNSRGK